MGQLEQPRYKVTSHPWNAVTSGPHLCPVHLASSSSSGCMAQMLGRLGSPLCCLHFHGMMECFCMPSMSWKTKTLSIIQAVIGCSGLSYVANVSLLVLYQSPVTGWSCLSKGYLTLALAGAVLVQDTVAFQFVPLWDITKSPKCVHIHAEKSRTAFSAIA